MENWHVHDFCGGERKLFTNHNVSFVMIRIPGSDFYIGETPVTQELWEAVMGNNPSHFSESKLAPVETVSYVSCIAFINKLNELTLCHFRLPSKEEWMMAARSGDESYQFPYAGSYDPNEVGWFDRQTHPVRLKKPNGIGLFDMNGNVWEWCSDITTHSRNMGECWSTHKKEDGTWEDDIYHILKGGSHMTTPSNSKITSVKIFGDHYKNHHLGMRLLLESGSE